MDSSSNSSIEKCTCDKSEPSQESDSSTSENSSAPKDKRMKISLTALGLNLRRNRSKRSKKPSGNTPTTSATSTCKEIAKKSLKWGGIKFSCAKKEPKVAFVDDISNCCKCMCYRRSEEQGIVEPVKENQEQEVAAGGSNEVELEPEKDLVVVQQNDVDEGEGVKGIYGISRPSSCICIGPWDMHW